MAGAYVSLGLLSLGDDVPQVLLSQSLRLRLRHTERVRNSSRTFCRRELESDDGAAYRALDSPLVPFHPRPAPDGRLDLGAAGFLIRRGGFSA